MNVIKKYTYKIVSSDSSHDEFPNLHEMASNSEGWYDTTNKLDHTKPKFLAGANNSRWNDTIGGEGAEVYRSQGILFSSRRFLEPDEGLSNVFKEEHQSVLLRPKRVESN